MSRKIKIQIYTQNNIKKFIKIIQDNFAILHILITSLNLCLYIHMQLASNRQST